MKAKLLKKLRRIGRNKVEIYSITTTNGIVTGMSYGHPGKDYRDLFFYGDTEDDVKDKAARIYIENWLSKRRSK